jgi:signal transduction histidine kinase
VLLAAVAALLLAAMMIRRVTHSLEELAAATRAVAAGDFDRRVSERSASEAGQVGRAFNAMTESLRGTLQQLARRESLAAVGAFAATLAHEIRNPLTAIRIDLQRVDETLPADSALRGNLKRALHEVERLDQTVTGALRLARSGTIASQPLDLRDPLSRALEVVAPTFAQRRASLRPAALGTAVVQVSGDAAALEQLFLNVLLNAAQALGPDGQADVTITAEAGGVRVDILDTGAGIATDQLARVFEPFVSSKHDGTGLGLAVAQQIVAAHGGTITIASAIGVGTTVSVRLPWAGHTPVR